MDSLPTLDLIAEDATIRPQRALAAPTVNLSPAKVGPELFAYATLAAEIGFAPQELPDLQLEDFLRQNGIQVLEYGYVCSRMNNLADMASATWYWHPLRSRDADCAPWDGLWASSDYGVARTANGHYARQAPYNRVVPMHILQLVQCIEAGFDGPARFFVTDYQAVEPDPFLMVKVSGGTPYVIGEWAEPCWRVDPKPDSARPACRDISNGEAARGGGVVIDVTPSHREVVEDMTGRPLRPVHTWLAPVDWILLAAFALAVWATR